MSPRRLTVGYIKKLCTRRALEHGREYCGDDRVVAVDVSDGVVSGEIPAEEDIRVTVSLRTGSRRCASGTPGI